MLVNGNLGAVSSVAAAPAGPFTVHFWAPLSKWLISVRCCRCDKRWWRGLQAALFGGKGAVMDCLFVTDGVVVVDVDVVVVGE